MFSPEMMQAAQKMMSNMKPEDMQRMTQMASNMDPKVMEGMMKNMGGQVPAGMDTAKAVEQMKNMSPEEMRAGMSQAQNQMAAQKQYMYNAAEMLKNEGNTYVKSEKYSEALAKYSRALENLNSHVGNDVDSLRVILLNNSSLCHLKAKDFQEALTSSESALKIDPRSFKALFRRGQAHDGLGRLQDAVADVRQASEIAPSDNAIGTELKSLRKKLQDRGLEEEMPSASAAAAPAAPAATAPAHELRSEWKQPPDAGGSAPSDDRWNRAAGQLAENPDMLKHATDMMSKMSPDDLQKMMGSTPLPPGMDASTVKNQIEHLQKNPDMLKTAMDSLQAMPEDERKKVINQRYGAAASGEMPPGADPEAFGKMFDNPEVLQQAINMTKNISDDDMKKFNLGSPDQADMMRRTAEQMASNPDLTKQMSQMMKNMGPEQLQNMMEMSSQMRGGMGPGGIPGDGPGGGVLGPGGMDPSALMSDPDMLKMTEQMIGNMSPEAMASMARASGLDLSEDKARLVARMLPYLMKLMRWFSYLRQCWSWCWTRNGRIALAGVVLAAAMYQHYRTS